MEAEKFLEEQDIFDTVPEGPAKFECKIPQVCYMILMRKTDGLIDSFRQIDLPSYLAIPPAGFC